MSSSMENAQWDVLSREIAARIASVGESVVAVHGGRRPGASGIHWRTGLIVTADHMTRGGQEILLTLPDRNSIPATLVGRDPSTDLALIKSDGLAGVTVAQTTTAQELQVGHIVAAVGRSHLGDLAASSGIVARLGAAWKTWRGGKIDQLIRPDLTLYPGQSGSALINSEGKVLGVNTTALARMATITVPCSTVERVIGELLEHGHIRRPYLGLAMQTVSLPDGVRQKLQPSIETGLLVMHVEPDGPAIKAGVMLGDLIVGMQNKAVGALAGLQSALSELKTGQAARLSIFRGGERKQLEVVIGDRSEQ